MRSLWQYCSDDPIGKTRDSDSIKFNQDLQIILTVKVLQM